jgi:hypothetical protein
VRFPGIGDDSRLLGVSRQHLFCVLMGLRRSPLLARYGALKRKQKARCREASP